MKTFYIETVEKRLNKYYVKGEDKQHALENFNDWNHVEEISQKSLDKMLGEEIYFIEEK